MLALLAGIAQGDTNQDKWNQMFHGASPTATITPGQRTAAPADSTGIKIGTDVTAHREWVVSPAQLARLQPWQPDRAEPPVPLTELSRRVKEYADKSFPERGWLLLDVDMLSIGADHTKWFYRFVLTRPFVIPEGQSYLSTMDIPPNSHFERASTQDTFVMILQDGTIIEPVESKQK